MSSSDRLEDRDTEGPAEVDDIVRSLHATPIDPGFSARVLRASRAELRATATGGLSRRAGLFIGRVAVPAALVACAAGYVFHYVQIAERVYLSHAP